MSARRLSRSGSGPGQREILEAAAIAFTRSGYEATTIDDIADQLGATKGRVYHYYRAKADIFLDVVLTGMEELIAGVQPLATGADISAVDRLWRMVHHHAGLMMTRNSFQRVAVQAVELHRIREQFSRHEVLQKVVALRDQYEQMFADVIEEGKREGLLRDVDPRLATKPALGALNWITIWYDPERGDYATVQRVANEYADFVVNGLRRSRT
ncbi:TetR/AcrR family transcriptional regulator [Streptomyces odontomachi]|uniref:TetR/AcrR family transcriptional regulator n=1 Tax=Streptomyces odontomachi TaxID=2944940 RepID=UPI00210E4D2E|nr:TetR/AcrR family transcriptional regulator [Streptomyces sp. ODS25]